MKTKKPDRFERMAAKFSDQEDSGPCSCFECRVYNVSNLLRRQHRAYVRIVKSLHQQYESTDASSPAESALNDIVDKFNQYKC